MQQNNHQNPINEYLLEKLHEMNQDPRKCQNNSANGTNVMNSPLSSESTTASNMPLPQSVPSAQSMSDVHATAHSRVNNMYASNLGTFNGNQSGPLSLMPSVLANGQRQEIPRPSYLNLNTALLTRDNSFSTSYNVSVGAGVDYIQIQEQNALLRAALKQSVSHTEKLALQNTNLQYKVLQLESENMRLQQEVEQSKSIAVVSLKDSKIEPLNKHDENWNTRFQELEQFKSVHGDCLVPQRYPQCPHLGVWVATQRHAYHTYRLSEERIAKLNSIGFIWDARNSSKEVLES